MKRILLALLICLIAAPVDAGRKKKEPVADQFSMKEVQAGAVTGGTVVVILPIQPSLASFSRVGKWPASIHGFSRSKVAPSSPTAKILPDWSPLIILFFSYSMAA